MSTERKTFPGGYRFKNFGGQPRAITITPEIPKKVAVPLKQGFGVELPSMVSPGDRVTAGQVLGRDDEAVSSPIHSSVNGVVESITELDLSGYKTKAVVIESDGSSEWRSIDGFSKDWRSLSPEKIEELLYLSGVTSLGSGGIPTRFKSSVINPQEVEHVIVHHTEADVFNHSLSSIWAEDGVGPGPGGVAQFCEGLEMLRKLMPRVTLHVVLCASQKTWLKAVENCVTEDRQIRLYAVKPKYPQSFDEVLVQTVLQKNFPFGYRAVNMGVLVLDFLVLRHIYESVTLGKPLIDRLIALSGPRFRENTHLRARIGTSVGDIVSGRLIETDASRYVWNSVLTGGRITDLASPVTRDHSSIIALAENGTDPLFPFARPGSKQDSFSNTFIAKLFPFRRESNTSIHGEKRACLSCNFCSDVCPVGILPQMLHRYVERNMINEKLVEYKILRCIDCNLCSYVCPSKIAVARFMREGKEKLKIEGFDVSGGDLSGYQLRGLEEYQGLK